MALIRESEFSRGYFVGGLGSDNNNYMDTERKRRRVQGDGRGEEGMEDGRRRNDINSWSSNGGGGRRGEQIVNVEKTKKTQLGNSNNNNPNKNIVNSVDDSELSSSSVPSSSSTSSSLSSPSPVSSSSSPTAWKGEWYGDRIEILVGSGDVYLQFEDEDEENDDPFSRNRGLKKETGFWKKFFYYPGFFSL